jgi:uncharacterized coiled-coil DUF342 family protein
MSKKDAEYFKARLNSILYDHYTLDFKALNLGKLIDELKEFVSDDNSEEIKQLQHEIKRLKKELNTCYEIIRGKDDLIKTVNSKVTEQGNDILQKHYKITELKCEIADLYMQVKRLTKNG